MFKLTIILILFGIVLAQSACTFNPVGDLPMGVWESESPYILLHIGSSYIVYDTQQPLGI